MQLLTTIAALLIGSGLGYWWRNRNIIRELPSNAVWLFKVQKEQSTYRVQLTEQHNWWDGEPQLWNLPVHEHPFALLDKHALVCADHERINVQCIIKVQPLRDPKMLEQMLGESGLEQINDAEWVFQKIQGSLRTSTAVVSAKTRAQWLAEPHELERAWAKRLNNTLTRWHSTIQIQAITATPDQFYNLDNPTEKMLVLKREQAQTNVEEIEARIEQVQHLLEQEKERIAHLQAKQAQAAELNIKWTALENHLTSRRLEIMRQAQEHIEGLRTDVRQSLRLTASDIQQEMAGQIDPQIIDDAELSTRNTLDTLLDSEQDRTADMVHRTLSEDQNDSDES